MKTIVCPNCDGHGYTIEIEAECCWNADYIERYGSCCGVPNPIQVQKECRLCDYGTIEVEE